MSEVAAHFAVVGPLMLSAIPIHGYDNDDAGPLGPLLNVESAARRLGTATHTILSNVQAGVMIGLRDDHGRLLIPLFQFQDNGEAYPEVCAAQRVLERATKDPWAAALWICEASVIATTRAGHSRLDALRAGDAAALGVIAEAKTTAAEWESNRDATSLYDLGPHFLPVLQKALEARRMPAKVFMTAFFETFSRLGPFELSLGSPSASVTMASTVEEEIEVLASAISNYERFHEASLMADWSSNFLQTWSLSEVADHLVTTLQSVRRMAQRGHLQFVVIAGEMRLPGWQFALDGLLYGVESLVPAFHDGHFTWQEVIDFMLTPHPALMDGKALAPVVWISEHRGINPVLDIVKSGDLLAPSAWDDASNSHPL